MYRYGDFNVPMKKKLRKKHRYNNYEDDDSEDDHSHEMPFMPDITSLLKGDKKQVFRDHNHIYYRCDVSMNNINKLCNLIDEYNREQDALQTNLTTSVIFPKPLYLHITSMGGDMLAGFMAHDYIKNSKVPIYTVAEAYTVSAGSMMFMAGKRRFITEHSYVLIHQLSQTIYGSQTFNNMMDEAANTLEFMTKLYRLFLENIRYNRKNVDPGDILTKEKIENHMLHDIYWNAATCIRYGLADGVYTSYTDMDIKDVNDFITRNVEEEPFTHYLTHYSKEDLKPSEEVAAKINENIKNKVSIADMVKTYVSNKNTMCDKHGHINDSQAPEIPVQLDPQMIADAINKKLSGMDILNNSEADLDMDEDISTEMNVEQEVKPRRSTRKRKSTSKIITTKPNKKIKKTKK